MASQRRRLYQAATVFALPGAAVVMLAALPPTPAQAQAPGADLKILSPKAGQGLGSRAFSLDVAFESRSQSPITTAELWVDGVRWVRQDLPTPEVKNVLRFAVDASTLSEGSHTLVVKVFCANGASSHTNLQLQAGDNAGVTEGSIYGPELNFRSLMNGGRVMGSVVLDLDAPAKNGQNPYVTIYIDKQFKTLKNYPPYTYTWDTQNIPNGVHVIEATGYIESANVSTTRRIKVIVDNPGGNTTIQHDVPDLSVAAGSSRGDSSSARSVGAIPQRWTRKSAVTIARPASAPISTKDRTNAPDSAGVSALGLSAVGVVAGAGAVASPHLLAPSVGDAETVAEAPPAVIATPRRRTVSRTGIRRRVLRTRRTSLLASGAYKVPAVSPDAVRASTAVVVPIPTVDGFGSGSAPEAVASPLVTVAAPGATIRPAAPRLKAPLAEGPIVTPSPMGMGTIRAFAPAAHGRSHYSARLSPFVPRAARLAAGSAGGPRTVIRPGAFGLFNVPNGTPFQVAFDGAPIHFDVAPRVADGIPLAPFRQIFEHTGGQVTWVAASQIVRAINADREVVITVGQDRARVNGQMVSLDKPAYVEGGRTMVPLSFVGQALNVDVHYDATTGHIQITSK